MPHILAMINKIFTLYFLDFGVHLLYRLFHIDLILDFNNTYFFVEGGYLSFGLFEPVEASALNCCKLNKWIKVTRCCLFYSDPQREFLSLRYSVIFFSPSSIIRNKESLSTLKTPKPISSSPLSSEFLLESYSSSLSYSNSIETLSEQWFIGFSIIVVELLKMFRGFTCVLFSSVSISIFDKCLFNGVR